jgi:amino acid transporter
MLLLAIICLGVAKACGAFPATEKAPLENFTKDAFTTNRKDPTSWSNSLLLCMYTFSGFEQPFYVRLCSHGSLHWLTFGQVLAESKSPRKHFPKYTVLTVCFATVLFILVNISYVRSQTAWRISIFWSPLLAFRCSKGFSNPGSCGWNSSERRHGDAIFQSLVH